MNVENAAKAKRYRKELAFEYELLRQESETRLQKLRELRTLFE